VTSRLQSLSLTESSFQDVLKFLVLPSLREISIKNSRYGRGWHQTEFMAFLSRSKCQLRKLVLSQAGMSSGDLVSCLEAIPSLEELEIGSTTDTSYRNSPFFGVRETGSTTDAPYSHSIDFILEALTYRAQASSSAKLTLSPSLHTIRLWGDLAFDETIFLNVVESRLLETLPEGLARLRSIIVDINIGGTGWNLMPQTSARIEELREQGLDIRLS
jgi:hypothetical protein